MIGQMSPWIPQGPMQQPPGRGMMGDNPLQMLLAEYLRRLREQGGANVGSAKKPMNPMLGETQQPVQPQPQPFSQPQQRQPMMQPPSPFGFSAPQSLQQAPTGFVPMAGLRR